MSATDMQSIIPSSLLDYLPAIYRDDAFLGWFLNAFEKLLLGYSDDGQIKSLEASISAVASYLDPEVTPEDFLPWLAQWVALSLRADLDAGQQRDFIASIIQLYRWRGTRKSLERYISIFTVGTPTITDGVDVEKQYGPHSFVVKVFFDASTAEEIQRREQIVRALIEMEKPAHTRYELVAEYSVSLQIEVHSTLGVDTLIGIYPE
jgi:phage tail-like protein